MKIHEISSERLTIDDIKRIMTEGYKLSLSKGSIERINACRDYLDNENTKRAYLWSNYRFRLSM